jgi:hypothetical protein
VLVCTASESLQTGARIWEYIRIPSQSNNFTAFEIHIVKNLLLMCLPRLVLRPDLHPSQYSRKVRQGIFEKNPKIDEVIEEKYLCTLVCNNHSP